MFWLIRYKLSGSYRSLTSTRHRYVAAGVRATTLTMKSDLGWRMPSRPPVPTHGAAQVVHVQLGERVGHLPVGIGQRRTTWWSTAGTNAEWK